MEEPRYFNEHVRCYSDGRVERSNPKRKTPKWRPVKNKPCPRGYCPILIGEKKYNIHRIIASCFLNLDIEILTDTEIHPIIELKIYE